MAARRRTRSEALEPAILEAAGAILEADGPEGLSIRRIAERAQVAPMGLYSRFDGKHGVVDALYEAGFASLTEELERATAAEMDPVAAVRAAARAYRAIALAHPARYALCFLHGVPGYVPSPQARASTGPAFGALEKALVRCVEAGALHTEPDVATRQLLAACHGFVALELLSMSPEPDGDRAYEALLDTVWCGLSG